MILYPSLVNGRRVRWCMTCSDWYPRGNYATHGEFHGRSVAIAEAVAAGFRSLADIGADYGISRERVRQIAAREGISRSGRQVPNRPRLGKGYLCSICGERVRRGTLRAHRADRADHPLQAGGRTTAADRKQMARWYAAGVGYNRIGRALGLPGQAVKHHLRRVGYTPHPTGSRMSNAAIEAVLAQGSTA